MTTTFARKVEVEGEPVVIEFTYDGFNIYSRHYPEMVDIGSCIASGSRLLGMEVWMYQDILFGHTHHAIFTDDKSVYDYIVWRITKHMKERMNQ